MTAARAHGPSCPIPAPSFASVSSELGHIGRVAAFDLPTQVLRLSALNRTGVVTDDLYQLTAYLAGFGDPASRLDGFLIYPADPEGQVARRLVPKNPWRVASAPLRRFWFVSVNCGDEPDVEKPSDSERVMSSLIHAAILNGPH